MKKILSILMMLAPIAVMAQSGTNSPYSQYGLGILSDQATGFNRGMGGVGIAMHDGTQVNYLNPASYSRVDSTTFLFDVGASLQMTNFKEGNRSINANNANFEYAVMAFRVIKNFGVSIGILPFSNIGYNYYSQNNVSETNNSTYTTTYEGKGGLRQLYIGAGAMPVKGLSIGANVSYLWGDYTRSVTNSFAQSGATSSMRYYIAEPSGYRVDFGMQYDLKLNRQDAITIGATYTLGSSLHGEVSMIDINDNSLDNLSDSTATYLSNSLFIPTMYGLGLAYHHGAKLHIGLDAKLEKWSDKPFPEVRDNKYVLVDKSLLDRKHFALGAEYVNKPLSRKYLDRIHWRAGISYNTPYYKVNNADGPKEFSASIGLGLPITNVWNNRSMMNISAQWIRRSATDLITENTFMFNIGITFNERWFKKWTFE